MTDANMQAITKTLRTYWKFGPSDDEIAEVTTQTDQWTSLRPLADALDYATRNFDDRPTIAWLLRDARRRRDLTTASAVPRSGCPVCLGEHWVNQAGPDDPQRLTACPRCAPTTHELQQASAYHLDAPNTRENPAVADIIARHDASTGR